LVAVMELSDALLHVGLRDVKFERCYGMRRTGNMEMKGKLVDTESSCCKAVGSIAGDGA
jgi:hypothetical protein